jgi:putative Holliday junction resolvase
VRWLGVDPGRSRVGLAVCDAEERVAVALEVVPAGVAVPAIRSIAQREEIAGLVVGLPLTMRGEEGEAARDARRLGERLRRTLGLPVEYEDERLTTHAAESRTGTTGHGRASDDIAAAILLQQFIDRRSQGRGGGEEAHDATA